MSYIYVVKRVYESGWKHDTDDIDNINRDAIVSCYSNEHDAYVRAFTENMENIKHESDGNTVCRHRETYLKENVIDRWIDCHMRTVFHLARLCYDSDNSDNSNNFDNSDIVGDHLTNKCIYCYENHNNTKDNSNLNIDDTNIKTLLVRSICDIKKYNEGDKYMYFYCDVQKCLVR